LEGVVAGSPMLSFVDLALSVDRRWPAVVEFVRSWVEPAVGPLKVLSPAEWFIEGHGFVGGERDARGIWIPSHAETGRAYLWCPPRSLRTSPWKNVSRPSTSALMPTISS